MKRRGAVLAVGVVLLAMFYHQGLQANAVSRLLTVYGVVEEHHLRADTWKGSTIDYAQIHGHIYSDKAPLASWLVVPVYWVRRAIEGGKQTDADKDFGCAMGDLIAAAIPFALFGVALYRRSARVMTPFVASSATLFALFGTSLFNYANVYYGHVLAGALFLISYALCKERDKADSRLYLAGFAGGLAVLAEYPLVLSVAILFASLFFGALPWKPRLERAFVFGLGALAPAAWVLAWNLAVTGSMLDFPYSHVGDSQFKAMTKAFGMGYPHPEVAWQLLFGQYRGLFFYGPPLLVLAGLALLPPSTGEASAARLPKRIFARMPKLLWALVLAQLVFFSSYFKWDGGWCVGPRHLTTVIMLLLYEGLPLLPAAPRVVRAAFYLLATVGIGINLIATATDPIPEDSIKRPLQDVFWKDLVKGSLNDNALPLRIGMHQGRYLLAVWGGLFVLVVVLVGWLGWLTARAARYAPVATGAEGSRDHSLQEPG